MRLVVTLVGALLATALTAGFAATATAAPTPQPQAEQILAVNGAIPPEVTFIEVPCGMPGDSIELRTGLGAALGAAIGGLIGLPVFIVGAIPGAIIVGVIGALMGASSYAIDEGRLHQQGLCNAA